MKLTNGQRVVLRAFKDFGPMDDVALTVYVHHIADSPMSSSGIRTRRVELLDKKLLGFVGTKRSKSGRQVGIHRILAHGLRALA